MGKGIKIIITSFIIISIIASIAMPSYSWFAFNHEVAAQTDYMGLIDVEISKGTKVVNGNLSFKITNNSTIGAYMRLGWTPIYRDSSGKALTWGVSGIGITASLGSGNPEGLKLQPANITALDNYSKRTIILEKSDDSNYFVVPAGTSITGTITVTGITEDLSNGESLHLILIPEAIQATKKAAKAAEDYGWLDTKAVDQAAEIYKGGGS